MQDVAIDAIEDSFFKYLKKHEPLYFARIISIAQFGSYVKSNKEVVEGFQAIGLNFKDYLERIFIPQFLNGCDPLFTQSDHDNMIIELKEGIAKELGETEVLFNVYDYLTDLIQLDANVDLNANPALNYVKKYQHDHAIKKILYEYLCCRPIGEGAEKSIIEKALAMPVSDKKFKILASLLVDTGMIHTIPTLHLAKDSETVQFLIDHGAIDKSSPHIYRADIHTDLKSKL